MALNKINKNQLTKMAKAKAKKKVAKKKGKK
jgi:hypothetical protein